MTVTVTGDPGTTVKELKPTVTPAGAEADRETAFATELISATVRVKAAEEPAATVPLAADAASVKSGRAEFDPQADTSRAPSTEPRPVARL
jgi:hypothetical protein